MAETKKTSKKSVAPKKAAAPKTAAKKPAAKKAATTKPAEKAVQADTGAVVKHKKPSLLGRVFKRKKK